MNMLGHTGRVVTDRAGANVQHAARKPGLPGSTILRRLVGAVNASADAATPGRSFDGELTLQERLQRTGRIRYR